MGIVDFNTKIWSDPWYRKLSIKAKNLFIFSFTNDHKNLACMYEMDLEMIRFYNPGYSIKDIEHTLSILYPKVKYDSEKNMLWVVNFVKNQFMRTPKVSPKIITGIRNNLVQNNGHFFIKEFLEVYQSLNISFEYPIDTLPIGYPYPPGEGEGEGEGKKLNKVGVIFTPPKIEDVLNYFKENGYRQEVALKAFKYYDTAGWKDARGNQVKNWKQKMIAVWFKDENKETALGKKQKEITPENVSDLYAN